MTLTGPCWVLVSGTLYPATIEADLGPMVAVLYADGSRAVVPVEAVVIPCAERT